MKRRDDDKLTDIMMGEAVLTLLQGGDAISATVVIERLQQLAANEKNDMRRLACERAIAEVRSSLDIARDRTTLQVCDGENVQHIFTNDGPPDDTKKH